MNQQSSHLGTIEEKLELFGYGEWTEEPDEVIFEYQGIKCKIRRNQLGNLCGYICIPSFHPFYQKDYDEIEIECHGGLTYSSMEEDGFWIGFDCGHHGDIVPVMYKMIASQPEYPQLDNLIELLKDLNVKYCRSRVETYKNIEFCIDECKSMVDQLLKSEKEMQP